MSGLLIIPLMYLASTSIVKFWTPMTQTFIALRAQKKLYSSIFACEYLDSQTIQVMDLKQEIVLISVSLLVSVKRVIVTQTI